MLKIHSAVISTAVPHFLFHGCSEGYCSAHDIGINIKIGDFLFNLHATNFLATLLHI